MRALIRHSFTIFLMLVLSMPGFAAEAPNISIDGADEDLRNNILNHLRIGGESCDTGMGRLLRLQNQVRTNTERAANALGYYKSSIDLRFSSDDTCWSLLIEIEPGEPVLIGDLNIALNDEQAPVIFSDIIAASPLNPGQQLNHGLYENLKNELSATAVENGYFAARFLRSEIAIDLINNRADIDLVFAPGPQFYFGEVSLNNFSALDSEFVRSLIGIREGEAYSNDTLMNLRNNLDQSQYFSQVAINPQLAQAQNQSVPLSITLEPRPRYAYSAGLGFTTDTGPRIRLGYGNRYQTRRGHRLDSDISLSKIRFQSNLHYTVPIRRNPLRESLQYAAGYIREDNDTFDSKRVEVETAYRNQSESGWLRNTFINYQRDSYVINTESDVSNLAILGFNLSKTQADDLINPRRGWKFFSEISGASSAVISDTSFIQTNINGSRVHSLNQLTRLLLRFNSGFTWIDDREELPVSLRFLAGGDQSLRGYKYRTLGPVDENNTIVGGKHLLSSNLEVDYLFRPGWRVALFTDGGNAFNEFDDIDWKQSIGVGVRWLSPIGPLRFDLAHTLNDNEGFRIHVTMGPDL